MTMTWESEARDGIVSIGDSRSNIDELLDLFQGPAWRADALCREYPDVPWFGQSLRSTKRAKAVCEKCLVRTECLSYAMSDPTLDGVWGGLTARERRQLIKNASNPLEGLTATA